MICHQQPSSMDWFKGKSTGKPWIFPSNMVFSCYFSLKPIHWHQQPSATILPPSARVGGIYVSQSGFSFGLQIPVSAVITSVAQKKVTSLTDFEQALAGVPNKAGEKGEKNRGGGENGGFFAGKKWWISLISLVLEGLKLEKLVI